jgi:hypothetical protein
MSEAEKGDDGEGGERKLGGRVVEEEEEYGMWTSERRITK